MKRMIDNNKLQVDGNGIVVKDNLQVDGQINAKDNIHTDGKITGAEIVEDMAGYSFTPITKENLTITTEYVGVVKNGNKLTLVWSGILTRTGTVQDGWSDIAGFTIPSAVGAKLIPHSLSGLGNSSLDDKVISAWSGQNTRLDLNGHIRKSANTHVNAMLFGLMNLTQDTPYAVRYEATFLLSDNLAA